MFNYTGWKLCKTISAQPVHTDIFLGRQTMEKNDKYFIFTYSMTWICTVHLWENLPIKKERKRKRKKKTSHHSTWTHIYHVCVCAQDLERKYSTLQLKSFSINTILSSQLLYIIRYSPYKSFLLLFIYLKVNPLIFYYFFSYV